LPTDNFDDSNIASETVYYYWLEDVDLSGKVTRHGLVQALVAGSGDTPNAVTLIGLQANSYATNLSILVLGPFGVMAALMLIKRRSAK